MNDIRSCLRVGAVMLAATLIVPAFAQAQIGLAGSSRIQTYSFDDAAAAGVESVTLVTTPFAATVGLGPRLGISVAGAFARGVARGSGGREISHSGLTDTDIGVTLGLGPDWIVLSADATLPTGANAFTTEEYLVAGILAAELLPFAIKTWGSGGSTGGSVAFARQAGGWGIGMAGGIRIANEYEPVSDQALTYRPGNQLMVRAALDRDVGRSGTLSMVFGFRRFGNDELLGTELFRSGTRLEGVVSYAFAMGLRSSALLYGGLYHRANGVLLLSDAILSGATDSPSQQLLQMGANLRFGVGGSGAILPNVEFRAFGAEDGLSQGWMASAGLGADLRLAGSGTRGRVSVEPSAALRLGRVVVDDESETGFTGWDVGVTLRVGAGS